LFSKIFQVERIINFLTNFNSLTDQIYSTQTNKFNLLRCVPNKGILSSFVITVENSQLSDIVCELWWRYQSIILSMEHSIKMANDLSSDAVHVELGKYDKELLTILKNMCVELKTFLVEYDRIEKEYESIKQQYLFEQEVSMIKNDDQYPRIENSRIIFYKCYSTHCVSYDFLIDKENKKEVVCYPTISDGTLISKKFIS
jgi:hypothetical protein